MDRLNNSPKEHITAIFKEYEASARVLQTLTNLSNTVIETALSGQCKFLFEILQNTDDSFDDSSKYRDITVQLLLLDHYLIIQHNGKVFDYYDVERICDYASQIEEAKANDLSKTGYKGLGFKSLFNLSDCIYIYSNGYSFRFDKCYWPNPEKKPWQVIPIWCDDLPLSGKYSSNLPVTFIMKISDENKLIIQLQELIDRPENLLYLQRVNNVYLNVNGTEHTLERIVEEFGLFHKIIFFKNKSPVSTWISNTYKGIISPKLSRCIQEVSQFIYPDKIKNAKEVSFTFTLCTNNVLDKVSKIDGLCFSTLPTQLKLSLPYHVNSIFILNLDRTQFHENEWNEFLIKQVGYLQLKFLKDLTEIPYLKNFVIELLVRKINHPYNIFNKAFSEGFEEAKKEIAWLPAYKGGLLKLGGGCVDSIHFFQQNLENIQDRLCGLVIDYDVRKQNLLHTNEAVFFNYDTLFDNFPQKYYKQLTENSYTKFLTYLCNISEGISFGTSRNKLMAMPFLKSKDSVLTTPKNALLEEEGNPIPDFAMLNPVDNKHLPVTDRDSFKSWLVHLGAKSLKTPIEIIRESIFQWIKLNTLHVRMDLNNHEAIIDYLAKHYECLTYGEIEILKKKLLILTKNNDFKIATSCYLPNVITLEILGEFISDDKVISSCYSMQILKDFFVHLGISESFTPIEVFREFILVWIKNDEMRSKLTTENYNPIVEFLAIQYKKIDNMLTASENKLLNKMPVLTCSNSFKEANLCYFDTAVPNIEGFENVVESYVIVSTQNLNKNVLEFLEKIGVSKNIPPEHIIRNSVLKWIQEGTVLSKINLNNHYDVLKYVAELCNLCKVNHADELKEHEKKILRKLPVLTKGNIFREACICYWQTTDNYQSDVEIPKLDSIFSANELVSSKYCVKEMAKVKILLDKLGVRHLRFDDIYDRYCDHLDDHESIKWFFTCLINYWREHKASEKENKFLKDLKVKLCSCHLLSENGKMYPPTELYSMHFLKMYRINENAVPLLAFENLPEELEKWLGIKQELELPCIIKLLESVDTKQNLGKEDTEVFFRTVLEQLRLKDKNQIEKYSLKLLSNDNKLTPTKRLYYFREEGAICFSDSCYLKRIHGMSHEETIELAKLCGVNLLPFHKEVSFGGKAPIQDETLNKFYLERLPLIVLQESKELNESIHIVLKNLFCKVKSISLYKCENILIKYPFGDPVETRCDFDYLNINVVGNWKNLKTKIHMYIKEKLELISDITEILDMESVADGKMEWLHFKKENPQKLHMIEELLNKLLSEQELDYKATDEHNLVQKSMKKIFSAAGKQSLVYGKKLDAETLVSSEERLTDEVQCISDNKNSTNAKLFVKRKFVVEASADENLKDASVRTPYLSRPSHSKKFKGSKVFIAHRKGNNDDYNLTSERVDEGVIRVDMKISPDDESYLQKFSEKCVFIFLQNFYKDKFPDAQFNLKDDHFTLEWQSLTTEIIWLNESEDKRLEYDLLLKKNGEVKQHIEVKSFNEESCDSFNFAHGDFIKENQSTSEPSERRSSRKYCIYWVLYKVDTPVQSAEKMTNINAIYKIVPLNVPSTK